jgi:GNAT superfamily N-acetyltransferase
VTNPGLASPVHLTADHDLELFDCGTPFLNDWLKQRALKNEMNGASRSYVVCDGNTVVGYYCLSTGHAFRDQVPKSLQRNMPDPIPLVILGRLAVDGEYQGRKIGSALLQDAVLRVLNVADIAGVKAILVHAISDEAKNFYLSRGFLESPIKPMTLYFKLNPVRQLLAK